MAHANGSGIILHPQSAIPVWGHLAQQLPTAYPAAPREIYHQPTARLPLPLSALASQRPAHLLSALNYCMASNPDAEGWLPVQFSSHGPNSISSPSGWFPAHGCAFTLCYRGAEYKTCKKPLVFSNMCAEHARYAVPLPLQESERATPADVERVTDYRTDRVLHDKQVSNYIEKAWGIVSSFLDEHEAVQVIVLTQEPWV